MNPVVLLHECDKKISVPQALRVIDDSSPGCSQEHVPVIPDDLVRSLSNHPPIIPSGGSNETLLSSPTAAQHLILCIWYDIDVNIQHSLRKTVTMVHIRG